MYYLLLSEAGDYCHRIQIESYSQIVCQLPGWTESTLSRKSKSVQKSKLSYTWIGNPAVHASLFILECRSTSWSLGLKSNFLPPQNTVPCTVQCTHMCAPCANSMHGVNSKNPPRSQYGCSAGISAQGSCRCCVATRNQWQPRRAPTGALNTSAIPLLSAHMT